MPKLSTAAGANVPQVFRQVFPNAGARLADPTLYTALDINKIAVQLDTGEQYRLASIDPTVWVLITGTGSARLTPLWKGGVPGDSFLTGDTVNPAFNDHVMFKCPSGDSVTFNMPVAGAAQAGFRIGFYDTVFASKSVGTVLFVPQTGQSIAGHPLSASRKLNADGTIGKWLEMAWDGDETWFVPEGLSVTAPFDTFVAP